MNKYIKPTISLLPLSTTNAAASSCTTSTADAKEIKDILISMGFDINKAFAPVEGCAEMVPIEGYCKFTSTIQVFFS